MCVYHRGLCGTRVWQEVLYASAWIAFGNAQVASSPDPFPGFEYGMLKGWEWVCRQG